jgi:hypothetical protein
MQLKTNAIKKSMPPNGSYKGLQTTVRAVFDFMDVLLPRLFFSLVVLKS